MSTTKEILNEVKAVLEADSTLKVYVQKIELGLRRGIPQQDFPIIMVEPATVIEAYQAFPQIDAHFGIVVAGYTRAFDLEARLVGDANYKGILELEKDIKLALGLKYPTLNGQVIEFTFPRTEFGVSNELAEFPVRGVLIELDLHYRTQMDTRS